MIYRQNYIQNLFLLLFQEPHHSVYLTKLKENFYYQIVN